VVELTRLRHDKELANLRTWCENQTGRVVCEGEALVMILDLEDRGKGP
jgi:acyl dehydratase